MSFLSVMGRIGHVVVGATHVAQVAAPALEMVPGVGGLFGIVLNIVVAVEQAMPATGMGPAKKAAATSLITAVAPTIDQVALSIALDNLVTALNSVQKAQPK